MLRVQQEHIRLLEIKYNQYRLDGGKLTYYEWVRGIKNGK